MKGMKLQYDLGDLHITTSTDVSENLVLSLGSCWRELTPAQAKTIGEVLQYFSDIIDGAAE